MERGSGFSVKVFILYPFCAVKRMCIHYYVDNYVDIYVTYYVDMYIS